MSVSPRPLLTCGSSMRPKLPPETCNRLIQPEAPLRKTSLPAPGQRNDSTAGLVDPAEARSVQRDRRHHRPCGQTDQRRAAAGVPQLAPVDGLTKFMLRSLGLLWLKKRHSLAILLGLLVGGVLV